MKKEVEVPSIPSEVEELIVDYRFKMFFTVIFGFIIGITAAAILFKVTENPNRAIHCREQPFITEYKDEACITPYGEEQECYPKDTTWMVTCGPSLYYRQMHPEINK